jgi:hypothetical protein
MARHIVTESGKRALVYRFGPVGEYAYTAPTKSAPNGEFWVNNPQRGWVSIPGNGRAISAARNEHIRANY